MVSEEKQKDPKLCMQPSTWRMSIVTAERKFGAVGIPGPLLQPQLSSSRDRGASAGRKAPHAAQHRTACCQLRARPPAQTSW